MKRSVNEDAEAQVAVILICAAIECALNDKMGFMFGSSDGTDPKVALLLELMHELNRAPVKRRLLMANYILHGEKLDFDRAPFPDYRWLVDLRNAYIHRHPSELIPKDKDKAEAYDDVKYHQTIEFFISAGIYKHHHGAASLPTIQNLAHSAEVARWAIQSGESMLREIDRIFGPAMPFDISPFDYDVLETS